MSERSGCNPLGKLAELFRRPAARRQAEVVERLRTSMLPVCSNTEVGRTFSQKDHIAAMARIGARLDASAVQEAEKRDRQLDFTNE